MFTRKQLYPAIAMSFVVGLSACAESSTVPSKSFAAAPVSKPMPMGDVHLSKPVERKKVVRTPAYLSGFYPRLSKAALERTRHHVIYDGSYKKIPYPGGDVAPDRGVCTDVVIRSYRRLGIDLQKLVYEDRSYHPYAYPDLRRSQSKPNPSIDHRRVRNLRPFFEKNGQSLPITYDPRHYRPGDLVTWKLPTGMDHIGVVVNQRSPKDPNRYMIVHNIGEGPQLEDVLFSYPVDGHYRYFGDRI